VDLLPERNIYIWNTDKKAAGHGKCPAFLNAKDFY